MWSGSTSRPYVRSVIEMNVEISPAAVAELQLVFDQAVEFTVARSRGKSVSEVGALLCDELRRRGIVPEDTTGVAEQIVAALGPGS